MKRIIALLLLVTMIFSLTSCFESFLLQDDSKRPIENKPSQKDDEDSELNDRPNNDLEIPNDDPDVSGSTTQNIPALSQNILDIPPANIQMISGNMSAENQVDTYLYTALRSGTYTFEFSEVKAGVSLKVGIYNRLGETIAYPYSMGNGDNVTVYLEEGETYTCKVMQSTKLGSYILSIGEQTDTIDVSSFSAINDSTKFKKQENIYTFVPEYDGRYTFEFSEVRAGVLLKMGVYNHLGETVAYPYNMGNNDNISLDLKKGETYSIIVSQSNNYGTYTLNIGKQKAMNEITVGTKVNDSVEFDEQINIYTFTATSTTHSLEFSNMNNDLSLKVYVYNYLDEQVTMRFSCSNDTISINQLTPGQTYTLKICQSNNFGSYTFILK